jgi:hypothetical protein
LYVFLVGVALGTAVDAGVVLHTALTGTERKRNQRELGIMRREKAKMQKQNKRREQAEARCVCPFVCILLNMLTELSTGYFASSKLSTRYFVHPRYTDLE